MFLYFFVKYWNIIQLLVNFRSVFCVCPYCLRLESYRNCTVDLQALWRTFHTYKKRECMYKRLWFSGLSKALASIFHKVFFRPTFFLHMVGAILRKSLLVLLALRVLEESEISHHCHRSVMLKYAFACWSSDKLGDKCWVSLCFYLNLISAKKLDMFLLTCFALLMWILLWSLGFRVLFSEICLYFSLFY